MQTNENITDDPRPAADDKGEGHRRLKAVCDATHDDLLESFFEVRS